MMDIHQTIYRFVRDGFILVFNRDGLDVAKTAQALADAGIGNMEFTCRVQKPLEKIRRLRKAIPGFCIGAASLIDSPSVLRRQNRRIPDDPPPSVDEELEAGVDRRAPQVPGLYFSTASLRKVSDITGRFFNLD
jgi:hypothetical protein